MVRILDGASVESLIDLGALLPVIERAFRRQHSGAVERPARPHYPIGIGLDPNDPEEPVGTGLVMPAYIHGDEYFVTKLVSVHEKNPDRDLPTIHAQIAVNEAATGIPVAYMDGNFVTAARTSCIGGLSARELTSGAITVGLIGAGTQARWQVRAISRATAIEEVAFYDLDEPTVEAAVDELSTELEVPVREATTPIDAIENADVVVTATTSADPVFPGDALADGTVVVAIGAYTSDMQEIDPTTFDRAALVFADVPEEVAEIGDLTATGLTEEDLVPFSKMLDGESGRSSPEEIIVVESVGSAVMDAAAAGHIYDRARERDVGAEFEL